jgi:hypothetical protein
MTSAMTTTAFDMASFFHRLAVWTGWLASHWQDLTDEQRMLVLATQEQVDRKLREFEYRLMGLGTSQTERVTLSRSR